ncbi:MAG: DUF1329 domain-containing protein [Candidatus Pelagadaptatus aseana]|uniref:DUF1329 domain-containing protein n=1 Tax=Candidatus Pelagadaptatus aseana TaxID=3120508 RepID=UPI0039B32F20
MLFRKSLIAAACTLTLGATQAWAGSAEEAAMLGGDKYTPVGAERAGNADGSIPAWNPNGPANFDAAGGAYPDPYAGEAKLFTIDASNVDQYADNLTEGVKGLIAKGNGFSLDVYPSHRDIGYADWIVANAKYNAEHVTLEDDGQRVNGNKPGVPFPFPKSGLEAIWNHMVRPIPSHTYTYDSYYVTSSGKPILSTTAEGFYKMVAFEGEMVNQVASDVPWLKLRINYSAPARRAGEILLVHEPGADFTEGKGRKAWQYLTGQRRVRLAPAVAFDTPNPGIAGTSTYDDSFIYNGSPERFSWTLVGKKEMYIPYNANKFVMETEIADALGENFIKPEYVRWEKHRVWVVEADLKDGKRHIYKKRRFYLDEDTWGAMASDAYDARDNLWRVQLNYPVHFYDKGMNWGTSYTGYDLLQGIYNVNTKPTPGKLKLEVTKGDKFFTPKGLARGGVR